MKRLAFWGVVCIVAVIVQMFVTHRLIAPHIDNYLYRITWSEGLLAGDLDTGTGWRALTPHYAWPILVTYGGLLVVAGTAIALAIGRSIVRQERQVIAGREAAVAAQVQESRRTLAEAEEIRQAAQDKVQAAMEQASRREQEAAAQVKEANDRLQGSVNTNIGRQKTIRDLRARVKELEG